jgi:hypothetical protein
LAVSQFLRNTSATLENIFYVDGTATAADGAVTVTVLKADGTTLSSGAASLVGTTYRYLVTPQANLNFLTITWTGTFSGVVQSIATHAEVVGNFLFGEAEARAFDGAAMSSATDYPDVEILSARTRITDALESYTGVSWVPRFKRVTLDGTGATELMLPSLRPIRLLSVTVDGTAYTAPQLADIDLYASGVIARDTLGRFTSGGRNVVVEYEHGYEYPVDGVDRIALTWLRNDLIRSNISDRSTNFIDDSGNYQLAVPTADRPTGIPMVDAWVEAHSYNAWVA